MDEKIREALQQAYVGEAKAVLRLKCMLTRLMRKATNRSPVCSV